MGMGKETKLNIAKRAAREVEKGMVLNLGIGIPSLVPHFLPKDFPVMIQAENGILGMGPEPPPGEEEWELCNAAGYPVTEGKGISYFDSASAFGMIRSGCIDMTILGSLEVSSSGDLSNWIVPGKTVPGMGGAIELAQKAKKVLVVMSHTDKYGRPKIVQQCSLPITAKKCVSRVITDMAVLDITDSGLLLTEVMEPFSVKDVISCTGAPLLLSPELNV
ncbi:3-oxoacid CoA-transferase subunit B [Bacillus sp. FJAT-42376]|uniref:3-oxoacid CoA-transferase subunit B n=1 Tax=Bacillus sp. FJAT-42376 TaxID=2014076 RepID=UPI000F4E2E16|nr:3-oxoacid CoA-transferase subunit B [Bacillus sp. FJAT-42376]AZB43217.1 3-oxoacid CoA-transferase subunit B [Bacillus sp. FJAT-42376]